MNNDENNRPVAYDNEGRPLYLHPPTVPAATLVLQPSGETPHDEMQVVQVTRSTDPVAVSVSPEMKERHLRSKRRYPFLNLSDGEYVVSDVQRHPIGIVSIWIATTTVALIIAIGWWLVLTHPGSESRIIEPSLVPSVSLFAGGLVVLVAIFGWAAVTIYKGNRFFLTNESVIQEIKNSLLSQKEQTINLENIKDASYTQTGFLQNIFGYGTIKLSTEGDDQEYTFTIVGNPKYYISIINNVVEAVKYGRPIDEAIGTIRK